MPASTANDSASMTEQAALAWIAGVFQVSPESIHAGSTRTDINTWDSMGVLLLMAGMDEEFGLILTDADMKSLQTVGDILALLRAQGKIAPAA